MSETLNIFGTQFTGVAGIKATNSNNQTLTYIIPQGSISINNNGNNIDVTNYATANVSVGTTLPTQHTINLAFSDNTDTDIDVYYSDSLIGTMITAYEPSSWTYNNKTVYVAELDNVEWYDATPAPIGDWETIYNDTGVDVGSNGNGTGYVYLQNLSSVSIPDGSTWRITIDGYAYVGTATYYSQLGTYAIPYRDTNNTLTVAFYNSGNAWIGYMLYQDSGHINLKIERAVTT